MTVADALSFVVHLSLFLLVLSVGMQSRWADLLHAARHPRRLWNAFLAVNVVVPATAILLCIALPVAPTTGAGLAIMAVSPLAPLVPLKMLKAGADRGYAIGLYAALILAAVLIVPATAALLAPWLPRGVTLPVVSIGIFVVKTVLVPLLLGLVIARLWPQLGRRLGPASARVALLVLLPVLLLILLRFGGELAALIGDGTLAVIVITVAVGLAAGHWLGGPSLAHRRALAQAAVTRHPGIAGLIAERHSDDPRLMMAAVLFLMTSIVVSAVYDYWMKSRPVIDPVPASQSPG